MNDQSKLMTDADAAEVRAALRAAEAVPRFVYMPAVASPFVIDALLDFATRTSRQVLAARPPSGADHLAAEFQAANLPTVKRSDHRTFLANLKDIAHAKMRVDK